MTKTVCIPFHVIVRRNTKVRTSAPKSNCERISKETLKSGMSGSAENSHILVQWKKVKQCKAEQDILIWNISQAWKVEWEHSTSVNWIKCSKTVREYGSIHSKKATSTTGETLWVRPPSWTCKPE